MLSVQGLLIMFILGYLIGRLITELQTNRKTNKLNKQVMNYYKDLGIYKD
jgi:membrane protein YqaA with SNARE-associated domain